jgi:hypothetical protein
VRVWPRNVPMSVERENSAGMSAFVATTKASIVSVLPCGYNEFVAAMKWHHALDPCYRRTRHPY